MKLSELKKALDKLELPNKEAIINLIDLKTENDMEKLVEKLESLKSEWKSLKWAIGIIMSALAIVIALISLLK